VCRIRWIFSVLSVVPLKARRRKSIMKPMKPLPRG
jgi:hypothetical protein